MLRLILRSEQNRIGLLTAARKIVDLVDNYNQGAYDATLPFDEVYGFSYSTLNMLLLLSKDMESLKENLKICKPSFISNVQIDKLFECYENDY